MNKQRRQALDKAKALISQAHEIVDGCASDELEAYENMSEQFQDSDRGCEMSSVADELASISEDLDEMDDRVTSCQEGTV